MTRDGEFTVEGDWDYQAHMDHMDLFRVTTMQEGIYQRLSIRGIRVNGVALPDWREFCQFQAMNNRWREDHVTHPCTEISFHGVFQLRVAHRRAQWHWTGDYHSDRRSDFVGDNNRWDCDDTHHCDGGDLCQSPEGPHTNRWLNLPHDPKYQAGDHYDYGTFGCSITQGRALPRGTEWPALLARDHRVCNLATPGVGIDGVFLNLQQALLKFQIDRMVVVLPSYTRRLLRFQVDGEHHRIPISLTANPEHRREVSIWMPGTTLTQHTERMQQDMGRHPDTHQRRGRRIVARMLALLARKGRPHWITSWNEDVYRDLKVMVDPEHLLPRFPIDHQARDLRHTSEQAHERWLDTVRSQISGRVA